jgi:hypothetical protein
MFRLEEGDAAISIRTARDLANMGSDKQVESRFVSARSATDPQEIANYHCSVFSIIIAGTVAKRAMEFQHLTHISLAVATSPTSVLEIDSQGLRHPIRDQHDLLFALEGLTPLYRQLLSNTTYHSVLALDSPLTLDLLARTQQILTILQKATADNERVARGHHIVRYWILTFMIGIKCQLLSNSEMSWDEHNHEFAAITESVAISYRPQPHQDPTTTTNFSFLPTGISIWPLWFTAVHCRDPLPRRHAIALLVENHRNEAGVDSWYAGHVAWEMIKLEEGLQCVVSRSSEVPLSNRILLRGFDDAQDQLYMLYIRATDIRLPEAISLRRHPFTIPDDPAGVVKALARTPSQDAEYLRILMSTVAQATAEAAPGGCLQPMIYAGEPVAVLT